MCAGFVVDTAAVAAALVLEHYSDASIGFWISTWRLRQVVEQRQKLFIHKFNLFECEQQIRPKYIE